MSTTHAHTAPRDDAQDSTVHYAPRASWRAQGAPTRRPDGRPLCSCPICEAEGPVHTWALPRVLDAWRGSHRHTGQRQWSDHDRALALELRARAWSVPQIDERVSTGLPPWVIRLCLGPLTPTGQRRTRTRWLVILGWLITALREGAAGVRIDGPDAAARLGRSTSLSTWRKDIAEMVAAGLLASEETYREAAEDAIGHRVASANFYTLGPVLRAQIDALLEGTGWRGSPTARQKAARARRAETRLEQQGRATELRREAARGRARYLEAHPVAALSDPPSPPAVACAAPQTPPEDPKIGSPPASGAEDEERSEESESSATYIATTHHDDASIASPAPSSVALASRPRPCPDSAALGAGASPTAITPSPRPSLASPAGVAGHAPIRSFQAVPGLLKRSGPPRGADAGSERPVPEDRQPVLSDRPPLDPIARVFWRAARVRRGDPPFCADCDDRGDLDTGRTRATPSGWHEPVTRPCPCRGVEAPAECRGVEAPAEGSEPRRAATGSPPADLDAFGAAWLRRVPGACTWCHGAGEVPGADGAIEPCPKCAAS